MLGIEVGDLLRVPSELLPGLEEVLQPLEGLVRPVVDAPLWPDGARPVEQGIGVDVGEQRIEVPRVERGNRAAHESFARLGHRGQYPRLRYRRSTMEGQREPLGMG
jgi:hypothetical protein